MTVKLGINGFGRIGRCVLRAALEDQEARVLALNHKSRRLPVSDRYTEVLAYSLKFDSVHGRLNMNIQGNGNSLLVNEQEIKVFAEGDPENLPWGELGVDLVVESTGRLNDPAEAVRHLKAGAKKVVLTAPAKGDALTVVMGVNHGQYNPAIHQVISNASCTTNCLAPVAKVLHDRFGIVKGLMTTVHAVTNDQQLLDMPHRDLRRGRAGTMSIIPTTTGAARAVGLVLPELKGRLNGFAMRVPLPNVSVVDLVAEVGRKTDRAEVNAVLKEASENELKGILAYSELPLVSCDFNGDPHSSIVDGPSTMVIEGNLVKVIAWYDNEWGYSKRVIDLVKYIAQRGF
jgi:glyceraldehyde 3-phosphate dehydrogenase